MKKWFLFLPFLLLFVACTTYPYYGLGPKGFLWPKGMEDLLGALLLLLLLGVLVLGVIWFSARGFAGVGEAPLAPRLKALREASQGLPAEKRARLEALLLEAWQALEEGRRKEAEAKLLREEALLDLLREGQTGEACPAFWSC